MAYPVLGFDCEWMLLDQNKKSKVAAIQLCSNRGLCAVFRICNLNEITPELKKLLENDNILKVGVASIDDAKKLSADYGVWLGGAVDLRYLAFEANIENGNSQGLARLSKNVLNVELDKDWSVRCSDWGAADLTERQVNYAAMDAIIGLELFRKMVTMIEKQPFWMSDRKHLTNVWNICDKYVDIKYQELMIGKIKVPIGGCPARQNVKR